MDYHDWINPEDLPVLTNSEYRHIFWHSHRRVCLCRSCAHSYEERSDG